MERGRTRRHGSRGLQSFRLPRRRNVPGRRHESRAYEHARDVHLGRRPGNASRAIHVRSAQRIELARRHAVVSHERSVHVHGAEFAVLDGSSHGVFGFRDEHVQRAERRRQAGEFPDRCASGRGALRRRASGRRRVGEAGEALGGGTRTSFWRISRVRAGRVHVSARLFDQFRGRRHGTSQ